MLKLCSKCKIEKNIIEFSVDNKSKDKLKSACKNCLGQQNKAYAKKYRSENRDLLNANSRAWRSKKIKENPNYYSEEYFKNHDKNLKKSQNYYDNNMEKCIAASKKWRKNNPEKVKQSNKNWEKNNLQKAKKIAKIEKQKYRARKMNATVQNFSYAELEERMSIFGFKCHYCGGPFEHIDHAIPLSKGGKHCLSNLRPSCKQCNNKKFNKNYNEWIKEIGMKHE